MSMFDDSYTTDERRDQLTNAIEEHQRIDMTDYQHGLNKTETFEEFHSCGNKACIAGTIALLPGFQDCGGWVDLNMGAPKHVDYYYYNTTQLVAAWLGTDKDATFAVIYGHVGGSNVSDWKDWDYEDALTALDLLFKYDGSDFREFADKLNNIKGGTK